MGELIAMLKPIRMPLDPGSRRGMVTALVALLLPVVIGVMALSLDGGLLYLQRQKAQSAADAAALAGAYQLYNGSNFTVAQNAAIAMGTLNGYTIPASSVTAPQSGYVAVSVTASQPRLFSAIWGAGTSSVAATAVARGRNAPYSKAAVLVLASSGSSVMLSGSTQVTTNGSVVVDSTSSMSVLSSGSPSITTPELDLSGRILYSGSNPNNATVTNYSQPNTPDPLASIPAPSTSGLTSYSAVNLSSGSVTLPPGIYNGGITLSGSASVTLTPGGTYYINGGGINMSGPSSITGNGVFIYNTGGGGINLSGTGTISLSPMTSGTYTGITVFQDRSNTASAVMSGGTNISNAGTFYLPSASLTLSGSSGSSVMGSQFIVNKITFSGTSGIDVNYNGTVASTSSLALVQ
jgi:Flp pilus assembly protein TadG